MQQAIAKGNRAVVISANDDNGPFRANLYVNFGSLPFDCGDITNIRGSFKTLAGAMRWAQRQLAV